MILPIHGFKEQIVQTIQANQVTIVVGETGSGKTTQLPLFLYDACFSTKGVIGITEPRRIAASSVAQFVAEQLGTELGDLVGYQVRFDDTTKLETKIKFMTDGILLREFQADPDLSKYSVIMIDEAHERSVNIDLTLGLLKDLLTRRADLKVVISSATIDSKKFSRYFGGAPVIEVSGRTYPVEIVWDAWEYSPWDIGPDGKLPRVISNKIIEIHRTGESGDILVFMTGADDINAVVRKLEQEQELYDDLKNLEVLPAHGALAPEDQKRIFREFPGKRKVIVATNIAETSITIDGVVFVIDSGLVKQTNFHPESGIQSLDVVRHSQAGCDQRAGRAGRTQSGICYRMYTEEGFATRPRHTTPEILRESLAGVVLSMENIGINDVQSFNFVDPPNAEAFIEAYQTLVTLGALTDTGSALTDIGRQMARLPLEPRIARMVLEAEKYGCTEEIVTIAAFLSARNVFVRPKGKEYEADEKHHPFHARRSDALTALRVWRAYEASGFSRDWCFENFLHSRSLWEIKRIREQLCWILNQRGEITSSSDDNVVLRCVASGLVQNLFRHESHHTYQGVVRDEMWNVFIHPGSSVFGWGDPEWLVATEIVATTKRYARGVTMVDIGWLPDLLPNRFRRGDTEFLSHDKDSKVVHVRRAIHMMPDDVPIGFEHVEIPEEEASRLQQQLINDGVPKGFVPLMFRRKVNPERSRISPYSYTELTGEYEAIANGVVYTLSLRSKIYPVEEGAVYYCEIMRFLDGSRQASAKFRVFDLPAPVAVPKKTFAMPHRPAIAADDAVAKLQGAWGTK